jgi:hypothetical protein
MSNGNDSSPTVELEISGVGYLDRIVELKSGIGVPFLACDVIALTGGASRRIEVTVLGDEAEAAVRRCKREANAGNAVLIAFRLSDIWVKIVNYKSGKVEACLKSRLVSVTFLNRDRNWTAHDDTESSWDQEDDR